MEESQESNVGALGDKWASVGAEAIQFIKARTALEQACVHCRAAYFLSKEWKGVVISVSYKP